MILTIKQIYIKFTAIILIIVSLLSIASCAPLMLAGAASSVAVIADRRTTGTLIEDKAIELKIANTLRETKKLENVQNVSVTSYNERVLVTGEAASNQVKNDIEDIIKNTPKVKTIYNEIKIMPERRKFSSSSYDAWLTTKVKTNLTTDARVNPLNIKVTTNNKTVYLMGLVTPNEADIATEITRKISGVNKVIRLFEYLPPTNESN